MGQPTIVNTGFTLRTSKTVKYITHLFRLCEQAQTTWEASQAVLHFWAWDVVHIRDT